VMGLLVRRRGAGRGEGWGEKGWEGETRYSCPVLFLI